MFNRPTALNAWLMCGFVAVISLSAASSNTHAADRPNILWITAEDMSPVLGCYGDKYAITPNIDKLATKSVLYTNAFATAPVCSPSRSCLINGVAAPIQGTHNMRSAFPIPKKMTGFPSFMRQAGYYTSNNVKTDYNSANWDTIIKASWNQSSDKAHWRNSKEVRKDGGKPFFSVFNLMTSHQSRAMVWPYEKFVSEVQSKLGKDEIHDPAKAPVPPYYPDTPVVRRTIARFYDCVTAMDKQVGAILKQLQDDGLADDTIVFFYSDHGSGMPRHKRALLDSGMKVAMMVHFPKKWQHLAPAKPGTKTDRLVSFDDFGPSVLSLAGVDIPDYMTGKPFLGPKAVKPRDYVYGHRDRVDEVIDMARSIRDKRYLLIRNFMPHLGYNQPTAWPDLGEIRPEFYRLADPKKMTKPQWHFAGPTRPAMELYDCEKDPMNLNNLAEDPAHRKRIDAMSKRLLVHLAQSRDLGFYPEAMLWEHIGESTPMDWVRGPTMPTVKGGPALKTLSPVLIPISAAWTVGLTEAPRFASESLTDDASSVRYWGVIALTAEPKLNEELVALLKERLNDESIAVRIAAADALARHGHAKPALPVLAKALQSKNMAAVLQAARAIELLGTKAKALVPAMKQCDARLKGLRPKDIPATVVLPGDLDMAMFIGFSIQAFLKNVDSPSTPTKSSDASDAKWIDLFDGKTLQGWSSKTRGTPANAAVVKNGEIQLMSKGKNLWFAHEKVLGDFELQAEALMPDGAYNSGLAFRCQTGGKKFTGYQCEIDRAKSGMVYAIGKGWVWPKGKEQQAAFKKMAGDTFKDSQWNSFRVRCVGSHLQVWVNGVKTADLRDKTFSKGIIAIQHHGKGDVHRFRNIRVRVLD